MANTILVGAQWGDEGKGKIIDVLTERADIVVRTQGGNNAGHTVFIGKQKYVLHLVPSGILRKRKTCVIGNGVVIDPLGLVEEIDGLRKLGIKTDGNLFISETAHLVFPYHREMDAQRGLVGPLFEEEQTHRGLAVDVNRVGDAARFFPRASDVLQAEPQYFVVAVATRHNAAGYQDHGRHRFRSREPSKAAALCKRQRRVPTASSA